MEYLDELFILLLVLQGVYNLYQRVTGGNAAQKAEEMPPPEQDDGTWSLMLDRARERVEASRGQLVTHRERARLLAERLTGPRVIALRRAVEDRVLPELDAIDAGMARLAEHFAAPDAEAPPDAEEAARQMAGWSARSEEMRALLSRSARLHEALGAIDGAARWRDDARLGAILGDVDAVADSMLAPLVQAARADRIDWPEGRPLTLPEVGDPETLRALLDQHPVVFVDNDVVDEQTRWPLVVDAVARAVVRTVPDLIEPLRDALDPGVPPWLPRQVGRDIVFDTRAAGARWLDAVAVDAVAAVMMGPVALHALIERLARPGDPYAVIRVRPGQDHRTVGHEPPAHLRVVLMASALTRLGYDVEARELLDRWDELHGAPRVLSLPSLFGPAVGLPVDSAASPLLGPLGELVTGRHAALGDRGFAALGGFEMSPGLWSRARHRAKQLADNQSFSDEPRVVVAGALLAADRGEGFTPRLDRAVHRLITHPGERAPADPHYRPRQIHLGDPLTARDLIEAVVLRGALSRPHSAPSARRRL